MQAILKLVALVYQAWQFARLHPKKSTAAVGAGVASAAMLYGAVSGPPAAFHPGNITNLPGSNGQVFESNGDGTYTFGTDDGGVGGGATELSGLDDVADTLTGNSGEFIGWSGTEWDDLTISLDTLSDAAITSGSTGEVLRYNGSAWVDATLDFDDLANTTITSWASGEVPRWNGSALVDSKLASTDLSDFASSIVGTTNDVIGWNGSAWDDVTISLDTLSDVTNTGTDGQVLASNGDGTATFETVSATVDATGITDGYVYTADGDATPAWEAPAVGGLLTPDGSTAVTRKREFDVCDYGASGKRSQWFAKWTTSGGTTTVNVRTSGDASQTHDLLPGNGVALIGAGAACAFGAPPITGTNASVTLAGVAITFTITDDANDIITTSSEMPAVTADPVRVSSSGTLPTGLAAATTYYVRKLTTAGTTWSFYPTANDATNNTNKIAITGGSGTHTIVGYTEHNHTVVCLDGNNGHSPPSAAIQSFGWNIPTGWTAHYRVIKVPVLWGAASVAIYGRGTSGRTLLAHLDTVIPFKDAGGGDAWPTNFTGIATASAGARSQLTGVAANGYPHGLAVGDWVNIRATSSGDTEYDVRAEVTIANTNDITVDHPFSDTATGHIRRGVIEWRDYGDRPTLHPTKYCPSVPNATLSWKASTAYCQGQRAIDSSGRWWRVARVVGGCMSGSSAPTWVATPNTYVIDNEVTWIRDWFDVPVAEPTVAGNQTLLTEVATVPSADTFTTVTAATADNATNALKLSHNAAKAFRDALSALKTYGRAGVLKISAGEHIIHLPKMTNTTYWTQTEIAFVYDYHFLFLNSGVQNVAEPKISIVADPSATVYIRMMQNGSLAEDLPSTTGSPVLGNTNLITQGVDNLTIQGGTYEWGSAGGGFTEWDNSTISYAQSANWFATASSASSANLATVPQKYLMDNVTVHFPTIATQTGGITSALDSRRRINGTWRDCYLFYGGGDGDQTFLPWGDFKWRGGQIRNNRLYGSHAFYLGVVNVNYQISDVDIINVYKNAVQMRGAGNDTEIKEVRLTNVRAIDSGPFLIGDTTSSNRVHNVSMVNCKGSIRLAEARNVTIKGGDYTTITMVEDCQDVDLEGFFCDTLELENTIDVNKNIHARGITFRQFASFSQCEDSWMTDCYCVDPYEKVTALSTGTYEWTSLGGILADYYQLSMRHTPSGNPGISAPAGMLIRGRLTIAPKANIQMTGDDYYYGNPEIQTLAITGSPTGGTWTASYNGSGPTSGIALGATAATVQTALRTLAGLSAVTVSTAGSGNNLTYYVAMTGVSGDPPQMTVAHTFTGGSSPTITPATPNPYPGYDTIVVFMGDAWRRDPDANPNDAVYTVAFTNNKLGINCGGSVNRFTLNNVQITSTLDQTYALVTMGLPNFNTYRNLQFNNCKFRKTGLSATTTMYMVDFGQNSALAYDDIEFNDTLFSVAANSTALRVPFRITMGNGGRLRLNRCKFPGFVSASIFSSAIGCVDMVDCEVQSNEVQVTTDSTTDAWNVATGSVDFSSGPTYYPVMLILDPAAALPTTSPQVAVNTQYWMRTDNNKLFTTESDANANASAIDITTNAITVTMRVMDASRTDLLTSNEWTGDLTYSNAFNRMTGNRWRGADFATYPQITANQASYQLQPIVNRHRLNTDNNGGAGRDIQGLDAPGSGLANWAREDTIVNVGSYPIVLKHASGSAAAQDQMIFPGATDVSIPVNGEVTLRWDPVLQKRRLVGKNF